MVLSLMLMCASSVNLILSIAKLYQLKHQPKLIDREVILS